MLKESHLDLRASYEFWLGAGGAFIALGGIPIGVTVSLAIAEKHSPWASGWFILGFTVAVIGAFVLLWALILYLAQRQAERRWPGPHEDMAAPPPPADSTAAAPALPVRVARQAPALDLHRLRSTLREFKSDLRDALDRIENAEKSGCYWTTTASPLQDRTWKRNRHKLSGMPGVGNLYDSLDLAFGHIRRINGIHLIRLLDGGLVQADDNLHAAAVVIRKAERSVERYLSQLG
jgi:hypothetical protein